ncbi:hypothetical protein RCC89_05395 [Cytophagaceae bacterium ABcell3]|nr:hypothetical protein RCC89_05395 [Cytophagaceae bacterium ABcell3]
MKVLLHLKIIPKDKFIFENKLSAVKGKFTKAEDLVLLDADNFSDGEYLKHVASLVKESEKSVVLFESCTEDGTLCFRKFMETLYKKKDNIMVLTIGDNAVLDKLLSPLTHVYASEGDQSSRIYDFLQD